jgi:hypothetical protein
MPQLHRDFLKQRAVFGRILWLNNLQGVLSTLEPLKLARPEHELAYQTTLGIPSDGNKGIQTKAPKASRVSVDCSR